MQTQEIAARVIAAAEALAGAPGWIAIKLGNQDVLARELFRRVPAGVGRTLGGDTECHAFTSIEVEIGGIVVSLYGPAGIAAPPGVDTRDATLAALRDIAAGVPSTEPTIEERAPQHIAAGPTVGMESA